MAKFGLHYEGLKAIKPDIIYLSMAGFGHAGPLAKSRVTYGSTVQALSGFTFMAGLPDRKPSGWGHSIMDHYGGYNAAIAVLMALYHRRRTGRGQYIDLSQVQAATTLLGTYILDYTVNGRPARREGMPPGNDLQFPRAAPHGVYPCQKPDTWVAIAVVSDEHWRGFKRALGSSEWTADERFATAASRHEHRHEIDRLVAEWTSLRDRHWIAEYLQEYGVPAAAVQGSPDLARDPQLAARGAYVEHDQPPFGRFVFDGIPARLSRTPGSIRRPSPALGEHTREICRELLGISDAEVDELEAEGVF